MIRNGKFGFMVLALGTWALPMVAPAPAHAQLWSWTREQMIEYTPNWTGERFADGRPKVPDAWLERARAMSSEEVEISWPRLAMPGAPAAPPATAPAATAPSPAGGRSNFVPGQANSYIQYTQGWQILHPNKKMVGRAYTISFMPSRPDLDAVTMAKARAKGQGPRGSQMAIDQLQPGDVLVVDLFGKVENGTIIGDNLFYYIMKATKGTGVVIDGGVRDLEGIKDFDMPAYFRGVHPSAIGGVSVVAVNVPVRIGNVTVMPGDLVFGDSEGVSFVPPQMASAMLDTADVTHIHDEWCKKKFDEGKYKSSDIYYSPHDPELIKEYQEYLKKRLEEIRKSNPK